MWSTLVVANVAMIAVNVWGLLSLDRPDVMPERRVPPEVLRRRRIIAHAALMTLHAVLLGVLLRELW